MELRHLKTFLTVAETLNFSRAADRIHLSQPALSLQIRVLEDEIGVRLLERNRRKTTLTAAGILFREEAAEALERVERGINRARLAASGKLGNLRVGFISTAAREIVPAVVRDFRDAHPNVELTLRHLATSEQLRMIEAGVLDAGFVRLPIEGHSELEIVAVQRESFVLAVPLSHRLAKRAELRLKELAGDKFVMCRREDAPGFHELTMRIFREAGVIPSVSQLVADMNTIASLVAAEMGVALLPASCLRQGIAGVVPLKIKDTIPQSTIGFACPKENRQPVTHAFRSLALRLLKCS